MTPRIETLQAKKLMGKRMVMSLVADRTGELWRGFMPERSKIKHPAGHDLYSLQVYPPLYFEQFRPDREFTKWALVQVEDFDTIPDGMESFSLPGGLYAVFLHRGPASQGARTFQYIHSTWLPQSPYVVDERPHFEVLGTKYKYEHADSEEEIWIPVRARQVGRDEGMPRPCQS